MALDVETPNPPDLTNRPLPSDLEPASMVDATSDLRRGELEEAFREGAWNEGFQEWAAYTDLTEAEYRTARDQGLFEALDFFWDPTEERIRFAVPELPAALASQDTERVSAELTELCRTVRQMLEDAYLDWGEPGAGESVWSEETSGDETLPEE